MHRDQKHGLTLRSHEKRSLAQLLAREFWETGTDRVTARRLFEIVHDQFPGKARTAQEREMLEVEVRTANFVVRDDPGNFGFKHKSFTEYFLACELAPRLQSGDFGAFRGPRLPVEVYIFLQDALATESVEVGLERLLAGPYQEFISENALIALYEIRRIRQMEFVRSDEDQRVDLPRGIRLSHAELQGIRVGNAVVDRADFSHANLMDANFTRCRLSKVDFSYAVLDRCDFTGAKLVDVKFDSVSLGAVIGLRSGTDSLPIGADERASSTAESLSMVSNPVNRLFDNLSIVSDFSEQDVLDQVGYFIQYILDYMSKGTRVTRFRGAYASTEGNLSAAYLNCLNLVKSSFENESITLESLKDFRLFQPFFAIAMRRAINDLSRGERRSTEKFSELGMDLVDILEGDQDEHGPLATLIRKETAEIVRDAIARLPETEEKICLMYYYDNISMINISNILKISKPSLYTSLKRAIRRLRELIGGLDLM